jgi:hypothetical protein
LLPSIKEGWSVARFEGSRLPPQDWIGVAAGALALVVSFLSWRHVSGPAVVDLARTLGLKTWYTAWGSGLTGWLPVVLLIAAAALILGAGFGLRLPGVPMLWAAMAFAALVIIIIRWATIPRPDAALLAARNLRPEDIDTGASIGLFLGLAAALISLLGAVFRILADRKAPVEHAPPQTEQLG